MTLCLNAVVARREATGTMPLNEVSAAIARTRSVRATVRLWDAKRSHQP